MSASTKAVLSQALKHMQSARNWSLGTQAKVEIDKAIVSLRAALAEGNTVEFDGIKTPSPAALRADDRNMEGAEDFIRALIFGQPTWPNPWGQDVAAAAFAIEHKIAALRAAVIAAYERAAQECEAEVWYEGGREPSAKHQNVWDAAKAIRALKPEDIKGE